MAVGQVLSAACEDGGALRQAHPIASLRARLDAAVQQAAGAHERVDEQCRRPVVDGDRRIELLDAAAVHDGDAVRDAHGLALVVCDHDGGQPELALQALDLDLHVEPQVFVERGERLIEQQQLRS